MQSHNHSDTQSLGDDTQRPPSVKKGKEEKTREPINSPFRQQKLKAWLPILTPKTVIPLLFAIGIIFTPLGGGMIYASNNVESISIDYSDCTANAPEVPNWGPIPSASINNNFKSVDTVEPALWQKYNVFVLYDDTPLLTTVCRVEFDIPHSIGPPVLFYYTLTNFYQNHRRYVKSFDPDQLKGQAKSAEDLIGDCNPLRFDEATGKPIYPCGLIANSLFNDTFSSPVMVSQTDGSKTGLSDYSMANRGISWSSDASLYAPTKYKPEDVVPPPNWKLQYPNGYTNTTGIPNLFSDEAFHVWMRTAGLPNFSKLAQRNDSHAMPAGRYQVEMRDNFPVLLYSGTKSIFFTTRTIMGGQNPFLGAVYVAVGGLCFLLGLVFAAIKTRKPGDHRYLSWNQAAGAGNRNRASTAAVAAAIASNGSKSAITPAGSGGSGSGSGTNDGVVAVSGRDY